MSIAFINIKYSFLVIKVLLFSAFSLKIFFLLFKFLGSPLEFCTKLLLECIATLQLSHSEFLFSEKSKTLDSNMLSVYIVSILAVRVLFFLFFF